MFCARFPSISVTGSFFFFASFFSALGSTTTAPKSSSTRLKSRGTCARQNKPHRKTENMHILFFLFYLLEEREGTSRSLGRFQMVLASLLGGTLFQFRPFILACVVGQHRYVE